MFRLDKGTFSLIEWATLGKEFGAEAVITFNYPDGTVLVAKESGQKGNVSARKLIKTAISYSDTLNYAELASRMNLSFRSFDYRLNAGKFSMHEWAEIGTQLGADVTIGFRYPDGTEIQEALLNHKLEIADVTKIM